MVNRSVLTGEQGASIHGVSAQNAFVRRTLDASFLLLRWRRQGPTRAARRNGAPGNDRLLHEAPSARARAINRGGQALGHWRTASFVLSIVINLLMLGCYENDPALSRYGGCSFNTLWEVDSYCTW